MLFESYKGADFNSVTVEVLLPVAVEVSLLRYLYYKKVLKKKPQSPIKILQPPTGEIFPYYKVIKPKWITGFVSLSDKWEATDINILQQQVNAYANTHFKDDGVLLMHAHSVEMGGVVAYFFSKYLGIPYVITEHQIVDLETGDGPLNAVILSSFNNAGTVICVSSYLLQYLLLKGVRGSFSIMGNYINEGFFPLRNSNTKKVAGITVLYDNYLKGADTFFEALKIIKSYNNPRDLRFLVVNGMPILENGLDTLKLKAENYGVMDICEFYYNVEREKMSEIYNEASFSITSSISETFGVAVCEAMCCGLPAVSTDCGGVREFLNEKNSLLVVVNNPVDMAAAINKMVLLVNSYDKAVLRNEIVEKYGNNAFIENLKLVYKNSLA